MASALLAESTQRNRVSGVRRRSRVRSCKTDARMLVASTLVSKISLTPRFARRCRCLRQCAQRRETPVTVGESILHLMSRSNRLCRTVSSPSSTPCLDGEGRGRVRVALHVTCCARCLSRPSDCAQSRRIARSAPQCAGILAHQAPRHKVRPTAGIRPAYMYCYRTHGACALAHRHSDWWWSSAVF